MAIKTYVSVGGQAKQLKKWYASVNGTRKELKKVYASVGGVAKLIYTTGGPMTLILSHKANTSTVWTSAAYYDEASLLAAINLLKARYGSTLYDIKIEEGTI